LRDLEDIEGIKSQQLIKEVVHIMSKVELLFLMAIIIALLFKIVHGKKTIPMTQAIFVFAAVIIATYAITFSKTLEPFEGSPAASSLAPPTIMATDNTVDPVFNNMMVYISSIEKDKPVFAKTDNTLALSNNAPTANSSSIFKINKDIANDAVSDYSKSGFSMKGFTITGPPADKLGIGKGTSPYSIFWYAKTTKLDLSPASTDTVPVGSVYSTKPVIIFSLPGVCDKSSVAAKCFMYCQVQKMSVNDTIPPVVQKISLKIQHADVDSIEYSNTNLDDIANPSSTSQFLFDKNYHLYTYVRTQTEIALYVDSTKLVSSTLRENNKSPFTNDNFVINPGMNWDANLMFFGMYQKQLDVSDLNMLTKYINDAIVKTSDPWKITNNSLLQTSTDLNNSKDCPYKQPFCTDACKNMTDWRFPQRLLDDSNTACFESVMKYCNSDKNSSRSECRLWSSDANTRVASAINGNKSTGSTSTSGTSSNANNVSAESELILNQLRGVTVSKDNSSLNSLAQMVMDGSITDPIVRQKVAQLVQAQNQQPTMDSINIAINDDSSKMINSSFAKLQLDQNPLETTSSRLKTVGSTIDTENSLVNSLANNNALTDDQRYQQILALYKADMVKKTADSSSGGVTNWLKGLFGL